jgi:hypothetical protein
MSNETGAFIRTVVDGVEVLSEAKEGENIFLVEPFYCEKHKLHSYIAAECPLCVEGSEHGR